MRFTKPPAWWLGLAGAAAEAMGLDVHNALFGNFHLNWTGTTWFSSWCADRGLPKPFIGWVSGGNDGDPCELGQNATHTRFANEWCEALERQCPDIAQMGAALLKNPPGDFHRYLYPHHPDEGTDRELSEEEWGRRAVAAWYAILRQGVVHSDTLQYC